MENDLKVNEGKGLFDKYGMISEMSKKLDVLPDVKGAIRCGIIWDLSLMLKALETGLKNEDKANAEKVEELKQMIEARE